MIPVVIAVVVAFVVVGVVMARQTSARKKQAIQSLKEEKETIGHYSILDMVNDEVEDLDLRSIEGAEDLPPDVLPRVWKDAKELREGAGKSDLAFVIAEGTASAEAGPTDVHLERRP